MQPFLGMSGCSYNIVTFKLMAPYYLPSIDSSDCLIKRALFYFILVYFLKKEHNWRKCTFTLKVFVYLIVYIFLNILERTMLTETNLLNLIFCLFVCFFLLLTAINTTDALSNYSFIAMNRYNISTGLHRADHV